MWHIMISPPSFSLISVLMLVAMWRIFEKADEPGWAALIPIYNIWVLIGISERPQWWIILLIVPLVNIVIWILICLGVADYFERGAIFGIGLFLIPIIFYPILAFTEAN